MTKSFNRDSIKEIEKYLKRGRTNSLHTKMTLDYDPDIASVKSLINDCIKEYNERWKKDIKQHDQDYRVLSHPPVNQLYEIAKNGRGEITDNAKTLIETIDNLADILNTRRTANYINYNESFYGSVKRNFNEKFSKPTSIISNVGNYLVLKPLQFSASIAVGSIGSSIAIIELALRFSFTCVSCIGFGTSLIAEKLESTNLSRKILGNQEFKIQEFQDSTLKTINNLAKNNYTGKKIYSYFFGNVETSSDKTKKITPTKNPPKITNLEQINVEYNKAFKDKDKAQLESLNRIRYCHQFSTSSRQESKQNPNTARNVSTRRASSLTEKTFGSKPSSSPIRTRAKTLQNRKLNMAF